MLVWVLGLLEGVCHSNHWTLVLSWKRTLDGPISFLKIFILLNQIQLFPFHAWGPFMLNLFLNFGWLGPGLRMNFDLSKVEKTVYYHVYGKMSFPAFHRLALRWKGKTNRRKSHVGILCIISNKILVSFSFTFALELQLGVLYELQESSKLTDLLFFSHCMYCILVVCTQIYLLFMQSIMKPETVSKMLINQMLLCFGTMFASQVYYMIGTLNSVLLFLATKW